MSLLLASAAGSTYSGYVAGGVAIAVILFIVNLDRIRKWTKGIFGASGADAITTTATNVVELLRTEVGELRTQLAEARADKLVQDQEMVKQASEISKLRGEIELLSKQLGAEEAINKLSSRIEALTEKITEGLQAILDQKGEAS